MILNVDASGQLTGATGVEVVVDGMTQTFDVIFVDGTCIAVFDGCDENTVFTFTTTAEALVASQALLDQVFHDPIGGDFDIHPELTLGCSSTEHWVAAIPIFVAGGDSLQAAAADRDAGRLPPDQLGVVSEEGHVNNSQIIRQKSNDATTKNVQTNTNITACANLRRSLCLIPRRCQQSAAPFSMFRPGREEPYAFGLRPILKVQNSSQFGCLERRVRWCA